MTTEASAAKKGKKKGKGKTVSLNTFLQDKATGTNFVKEPPKSTGNWADATEELDPSEISTQWPDEKSQDKVFDLSVLPSAPRASEAPKVDRSRLPSKPPYTVYLGNLSYECSEDDIAEFFAKKKLQVCSVRLPVESNSQRLRGFGYAEFATISDLVEALSLNGDSLRNRQVSVDIAGGKSTDRDRGDGRRPRYEDTDERTSGDWRSRDDRDSPSRGEYGGGGGSRDYGGPSRERGEYQDARYERRGPDRYGDRDREYGRRDYDRGGPPQRSRDFGQNWGGGGGSRDQDDRGRDDYRSRRDEGGEYGRRDERYDRYPRDGAPRGRSYDDDRGGGASSRYGRDYEDRRGGGGGWGSRRSPEQDREGGRRQEEPPGERRKLLLQPRSKPLEGGEGGGAGGSSIFGGAKPVDTASREKEIEERLIKRKEESIETKPKERTNSSSVFGDARPVDTATKEREVEEKLLAEKEQLEKEIEQRERRTSEGERRERHLSEGERREGRSSERDSDKDAPQQRSRSNRERIGSRDSVEGGGGEGGEGGDKPAREERGASSRGGRGRNRDDDRGSRGRGTKGRGRGRGGNYYEEDRRGSYENRRGSHDDRYKSRDDPEERGKDRGGQGSAWERGKPRSLGGAKGPKAALKKQEEDTPVFSQPSRFATLEQEREEEEREGGKATPEKEAGPQNTEDV